MSFFCNKCRAFQKDDKNKSLCFRLHALNAACGAAINACLNHL